MKRTKRQHRQTNLIFGMFLSALLLALTLNTDPTSISRAQILITQKAAAAEVQGPEVPTKTGEVVAVPPAQVLKVTADLNEVSDDEFFMSIANAFGQSHGASALVIIGILAQLLIQFTKTRLFGQLFRKVDGKGRLAIVLVLTSVTTFVGLMSQGMGWVAAITSGAFMSTAMVAGHQVYKLFVKEPIADAKNSNAVQSS